MGQDLPFACACGKVAGHLADFTPSKGTHAICHCASCRAGELYCGAPDPGTEGVGILQISPHFVTLDRGADHLDIFSFGEKNILRWRASCCGVPMFNTARNPRIAFVGIRTTLFQGDAPIGPVAGHAFRPQPNGKTRHEGLARFIWDGLRRIGGNRLTGRWRKTPFFDTATETPIAPITIVPKSTRKDLLASPL